jgi:transcriptional repressor NrdR
MKCPYCGSENDRVLDSRSSEEGFATRRRRQCVDCKRRYTTMERLEDLQTRIVKKDGGREPFERGKIRRGLEKACWKRPISSEVIEELVSAIEAEIFDRLEAEVESREVGELVMQKLRDLDQVAYVRFASVYREFTDVADFVDELQPILRERRRAAKRPARAPAQPDGNRGGTPPATPSRAKSAGGRAASDDDS